MKDHLIPDAVILIDNSIIVDFGEMRTSPIPADCEIIDADGLYVGPGLVDIHLHNGGEAVLVEDPVTALQYHLRNGSTPFCLQFILNLTRMLTKAYCYHP